jgi:putative ABC transport system permease protein
VVYVSEAMIDLYEWRPGTIQTLPAFNERQGSQKVWIAGIFRDYGRQHGALVMDLGTYQLMSGDQQYSGIAIWLVNQAKIENLDFVLKFEALKGEIEQIEQLGDDYLKIYEKVLSLKKQIEIK